MAISHSRFNNNKAPSSVSILLLAIDILLLGPLCIAIVQQWQLGGMIAMSFVH